MKTKDILSLPREAKEGEYVGIDTEFFGMNEDKLHRPHGTFACATFAFEDGTTYIIQDEHDIREALTRVSKGKWIFHNAAFDIRQLRRYAAIEPRRVWDIMLVEQGLFGGYYSRFSLGTMAARYLGVPLEKETREEFSKRTTMSADMLKYAAKDAQATLKIGKLQIKMIQEESRSIKHYWLADHPAMWASLDMKPAVVNVDAWLVFATMMEEEAARLESTFDFNPRSPLQLKNVLIKALRRPIESTDADVLEGLLEEYPDNDTLRNILTYRSYQKMASTYGKSWIEQHVEGGRYVYTNWKIVGALTGRMACVSGDTSILTSNGYTAISQLQPGVKVFTHLGRWKKVTGKFIKGSDVMYEVISHTARIVCTLDHLLYTENGWMKLRDLKVGSLICAFDYETLSSFNAEILSIKSVGEKIVWDIEVEDDHSYFAQGMFHHNSDSPNLQNIPSKKQPKYRDFFICDKGEIVMVMDVAQQEPRILCVLSDDAMLKNILLHGLSPHIELGKNIYNDPNFSKADPRYAVAKSTNLGLSYGLTATGLARDTGIPLKEAERVLKVYFQTFPGVQSYMNRYRHMAARQGYTETLLGRRSFINPYTYKWKNNAINSPIQGTAGDQMKIVMGLLHKECALAGLEFSLMMTVHDETVFRFPKGQRSKFEKLAEEAWREAGRLTLGDEIPLLVEVGVGENWGCKK